MNQKSLEFRVGLAIFIASMILIIGLMWFQGFKIRRSTYVLNAVFPMVGGIDHGDEVSVNGVEKGEVENVLLREHDVLVTMKLTADVRVPEDSHVILQTIGVMGERVVVILLGQAEAVVGPGDTLQGIYDPGMSEALASLGHLMEDLTALTVDIRRIAGVISEGEKLEKTIDNLATITGELKRLIADNAPYLEKGIASFRNSAERVDGFLDRNTAHLDSVVVSLRYVTGELPELLEHLREVTGSLSELTRYLETDESTLGALLRDRELLDKLEGTVGSLDELIKDIKKNPKKYLKVEIF
ncbi:MAG TPA: MlaD family protein [Patescibacteria group bacterium]|nr:MlaD family protein [Patescibacteria group bacterium]